MSIWSLFCLWQQEDACKDMTLDLVNNTITSMAAEFPNMCNSTGYCFMFGHRQVTSIEMTEYGMNSSKDFSNTLSDKTDRLTSR